MPRNRRWRCGVRRRCRELWITTSAKRRFSSTGHWAASRRSNSASVQPRALARASRSSRGESIMRMTIAHRFPAGFQQQRGVQHDGRFTGGRGFGRAPGSAAGRFAGGAGLRETCGRPRRRRLRRTRVGRWPCGRPDRRRRKCRRPSGRPTARRTSASSASTAWPVRSASRWTAPSSTSIFAASDLPLATPPTRPMVFIVDVSVGVERSVRSPMCYSHAAQLSPVFTSTFSGTRKRQHVTHFVADELGEAVESRRRGLRRPVRRGFAAASSLRAFRRAAGGGSRAWRA